MLDPHNANGRCDLSLQSMTSRLVSLGMRRTSRSVLGMRCASSGGVVGGRWDALMASASTPFVPMSPLPTVPGGTAVAAGSLDPLQLPPPPQLAHDPMLPLCTSTETAGPLLGAVQDALLLLHGATGLPWWATLVTATLCVRTSLLPLVMYQMKASNRFGAAMPHMMTVKEALQRAIKELEMQVPPSGGTLLAKVDKLKMGRKGMQLIWQKFDCHPAKLVVTPLVHIPIFLTYVFSVRDMIRGEVSGLASGGAAWFPDLTAADSTLVLPVLAAGLTYVNLEQGLGGSQNKWLIWGKDKIQLLMIGLQMFTAELPAGIFMYWVTSASYGIVQTAALRNPSVQKALGLLPPKPPNLPTI